MSQRGESFKVQCFLRFSSCRAKSLILSDAADASDPALMLTSRRDDIFVERSSVSETEK